MVWRLRWPLIIHCPRNGTGKGRGFICHKGSVPNTLLHLQHCFYRCNTILWWTRLYHPCIQMLYRTCTCYNCLPEDEPSGSKHVYGEYVVKIILNITEMHIVGLQNIIISQCTVQINTALDTSTDSLNTCSPLTSPVATRSPTVQQRIWDLIKRRHGFQVPLLVSNQNTGKPFYWNVLQVQPTSRPEVCCGTLDNSHPLNTHTSMDFSWYQNTGNSCLFSRLYVFGQPCTLGTVCQGLCAIQLIHTVGAVTFG